MKLFRFALNTWITVASLLSFLLGWVFLAHSPKPVQPSSQPEITSPAALPTLTPLQDLQLNSDNGNNNLLNFQAPSNNFNSAPAPIFRTSGS